MTSQKPSFECSNARSRLLHVCKYPNVRRGTVRILVVGAIVEADSIEKDVFEDDTSEEDAIELRPLENIWGLSEDRRALVPKINKTGSACLNNQSFQAMIDVQSQTAKVLARFFRPLEYRDFIYVTFDIQDSTLEIELPRYRIAFSLASRQSIIESKQYRGFVIDKDQSLGTLVGLQTTFACLEFKIRHSRIELDFGE